MSTEIKGGQQAWEGLMNWLDTQGYIKLNQNSVYVWPEIIKSYEGEAADLRLPETERGCLDTPDDMYEKEIYNLGGQVKHEILSDEAVAYFENSSAKATRQGELFYCGRNHGYGYERCNLQCAYCASTTSKEPAGEGEKERPTYEDLQDTVCHYQAENNDLQFRLELQAKRIASLEGEQKCQECEAKDRAIAEMDRIIRNQEKYIEELSSPQ